MPPVAEPRLDFVSGRPRRADSLDSAANQQGTAVARAGPKKRTTLAKIALRCKNRVIGFRKSRGVKCVGNGN